jgi:hypothetical protein
LIAYSQKKSAYTTVYVDLIIVGMKLPSPLAQVQISQKCTSEPREQHSQTVAATRNAPIVGLSKPEDAAQSEEVVFCIQL